MLKRFFTSNRALTGKSRVTLDMPLMGKIDAGMINDTVCAKLEGPFLTGRIDLFDGEYRTRDVSFDFKVDPLCRQNYTLTEKDDVISLEFSNVKTILGLNEISTPSHKLEMQTRLKFILKEKMTVEIIR